jgi:hypothetical protein
MAAIVSAADYATWRTGSTAVMTDTQFPFYEKKAETELARLTFDQLKSVVIVGTVATIVIDDVTYTLVLDDIKFCLCEIAEFLYQVEQAQASGLTSFSNDGQSGSYDASRFSASGKQKQLRMIAKTYLAGTVLLKAGVSALWHD